MNYAGHARETPGKQSGAVGENNKYDLNLK